MIELILSVLAVYRVARMLALEEGAFGAFAWVRERIDPEQETWLGRGVNCPLCISFWLAALPAAYLTIEYQATIASGAIMWLGIAGACVILFNLAERE